MSESYSYRDSMELSKAQMVRKDYITEDSIGYARRTRCEYTTTVMVRDESVYESVYGMREGCDAMDAGCEKAYIQLARKLQAEGYPEGAYQIEFNIGTDPSSRMLRIVARAVVFEEDRIAYDGTNMWVSRSDKERTKYFDPYNQPMNPKHPLIVSDSPPPDMDGPVVVRRAKITEG